jgi:hypothetical protein
MADFLDGKGKNESSVSSWERGYTYGPVEWALLLSHSGRKVVVVSKESSPSGVYEDVNFLRRTAAGESVLGLFEDEELALAAKNGKLELEEVLNRRKAAEDLKFSAAEKAARAESLGRELGLKYKIDNSTGGTRARKFLAWVEVYTSTPIDGTLIVGKKIDLAFLTWCSGRFTFFNDDNCRQLKGIVEAQVELQCSFAEALEAGF